MKSEKERERESERAREGEAYVLGWVRSQETEREETQQKNSSMVYRNLK